MIFTSFILVTGTSVLLPCTSDGFRLQAKKSFTGDEKPPFYYLPDDSLVSAFLQKEKTEPFLYLLQREVKYLTFVIIPCSSRVTWSLSFRPTNDTGKVKLDERTGTMEEWSNSMVMKHTIEAAKPGLYHLRVSGEDTAVEVFVSSHHRSGYPGLDLAPAPIVVLPSRTPGTLTLLWQPSPLDPQWLHYWASVSRAGHHNTLCGALRGQAKVHSTLLETKLTLTGLHPGLPYSVDVFAQHSFTNISFLYARGVATYSKPRPTPLRDQRPASVDLQILSGRANFRYKVREIGRRLEWYVEVCGGGLVEAQVRLRKKVVVGPVLVKGLASLALPSQPLLGARYILRLSATDPEQLVRISRVEVMGSMRGLPVVKMPADVAVHEFQGLKRCRGVTLGWRPVGAPTATYCMRATRTPPEADPCALHESLNSLGFASLQCYQLTHQNATIITKELSDLKPGRTYYVQVTVKTNKTKMASYNVIQVYTKTKCSQFF